VPLDDAREVPHRCTVSRSKGQSGQPRATINRKNGATLPPSNRVTLSFDEPT
jgi:hypothetical protein